MFSLFAHSEKVSNGTVKRMLDMTNCFSEAMDKKMKIMSNCATNLSGSAPRPVDDRDQQGKEDIDIDVEVKFSLGVCSTIMKKELPAVRPVLEDGIDVSEQFYAKLCAKDLLHYVIEVAGEGVAANCTKQKLLLKQCNYVVAEVLGVTHDN